MKQTEDLANALLCEGTDNASFHRSESTMCLHALLRDTECLRNQCFSFTQGWLTRRCQAEVAKFILYMNLSIPQYEIQHCKYSSLNKGFLLLREIVNKRFMNQYKVTKGFLDSSSFKLFKITF